MSKRKVVYAYDKTGKFAFSENSVKEMGKRLNVSRNSISTAKNHALVEEHRYCYTCKGYYFKDYYVDQLSREEMWLDEQIENHKRLGGHKSVSIYNKDNGDKKTFYKMTDAAKYLGTSVAQISYYSRNPKKKMANGYSMKLI